MSDTIYRKVYKREDDEKGNDISYSVDINSNKKQINWELYPHEPKGIHWKAADQMGLGRSYHQKTQTFDEFLNDPHDTLSEEIRNEIIAIINDLK